MDVGIKLRIATAPDAMNVRSAGAGIIPGNLRKLIFFIFSRTKMIFYTYRYCEDTPSHWSNNGFSFRALAYSDHEKLLQSFAIQGSSEKFVFQPIKLQQVIERLHRGEMCYIGETKGKIAGYCWIVRNKFYIYQIDHAINLEPTDLYFYNAYVLKKYRRYDVMKGNILAVRRDLIPQGFNREIIAIMNWNNPSRQFALKMGFEEAGSITTGYVLTFRYTINTCKHLNFSSEAGVLDFYRRLFNKFKSLIN